MQNSRHERKDDAPYEPSWAETHAAEQRHAWEALQAPQRILAEWVAEYTSLFQFNIGEVGDYGH